MRKISGLALMRPQLRDSGHAKCRVERRGDPVGPRHQLLVAGRYLMNVQEPPLSRPAGQT